MCVCVCVQICSFLSRALTIHPPVQLSWFIDPAMFAGSASLAHPDWSILAAVPVELDMDLPPPEGSLLQSSALSREGTLTPAEAALVKKRLAQHGPTVEQLQDQQVPPEELVMKRPSGGMKRPAGVMKRPAAAVRDEGVCKKRPAAKKS